MTITQQIGSGLPLFELPGDRFINATQPLRRLPLLTRPLSELETARFLKTGAVPSSQIHSKAERVA